MPGDSPSGEETEAASAPRASDLAGDDLDDANVMSAGDRPLARPSIIARTRAGLLLSRMARRWWWWTVLLVCSGLCSAAILPLLLLDMVGPGW